MYLCVHVPDFAAQAATRLRPELRRSAVAVLYGEHPLEKVFAVNPYAQRSGVSPGMSRLQAESFPKVQLLIRHPEEEASAQNVLLEHAAEFSPRIELVPSRRAEQGGGTAVLDITGSDRLFGGAAAIAESLRTKIAADGLIAHIAASHNFHAAICLARGIAGVTVLSSGEEVRALSPLTLDALDISPEASATFHLWGVHTCGALANLPEAELISRLGQEGKRLRQLARGECAHLLVPFEKEFDAGLTESFRLEDQVEFLEPLLFLIARMLDTLMQRAMARALAVASVQVTLQLATELHAPPRTHQRSIRPALPTQDTRTLLKLVQLEMETHPPDAAIIGIEIKAVSARPHRAQHGMFMPQAPEPGRLEILLARLRKLLGEERLGAPQLLDTHKPDSFRMSQFTPVSPAMATTTAESAKTVLRVCRPPRVIRVDYSENAPRCIWMDGERFIATQHAGPWRKSGEWWSHDNWCREEWDVALADAKSERLCRIAHDPASGAWYLQGTYD
jgi:protein ImuB